MEKSKTKNCQNCKADFVIEKDDFDFYERIDVPEPTFCPDCRAQRRMAWRNERKLYKRNCDFSKKEVFSWLLPEAPAKMYDSEIWWSDKWDAIDLGREYDFDKPFFQQFLALLRETPLPSRSYLNFVNSDYSMNASGLKNCYFIFNAGQSENCSYGVNVDICKDCVDNFFLTKCELCYESIMLNNCFKTFFSSHCDDCQEIMFCKNCIDCSSCFACTNLRHKKYHIFNEPYSKEEYFEKLKQFDIGSFEKKEEIFKSVKKFWLENPVRFMHGRKNNNVSGEYIFNSKNVKDSYMVDNGENLRFSFHARFVPGAKDCYDYSGIGRNSELCYENIIVGRNASKIKFCSNCYENVQNFEYCVMCVSSSDLFGCVSLRKKQYCILNKQYTKEEYEELVPQIKAHMNEMPFTDKAGNEYRYGEFFPAEFSPFAYNEATAYEQFPLKREGAIAKGYFWYDKPKNTYQPTIKSKNLPDHIKDVEDSILEDIVECANDPKGICQGSGVFRIIPSELQFYKKHNLPLPRLCADCRHIQRLRKTNPMKLNKRQCMCDNKNFKNQQDHGHGEKRCENTFETTYSPDRLEIVYCKDCYQKEVE